MSDAGLRRSKTDATPRTVYLIPIAMARRMARAGVPSHEIMAQGRWRSAGMVTAYTWAENAERAAKWLG